MVRFLPILLALALASPAVNAQGMYRSVMPDGKIVYSDKPTPGAKESTKLNLAPLNVAKPPPAPRHAAEACARRRDARRQNSRGVGGTPETRSRAKGAR